MSGALHVVALALAGAAALLTLACGVGVLVMRDAFQRLHFVAPPATLGAFLVAAAVWLDGAGATAGLKSVVVLALLAAQAGVLGHATARAFFVRAQGGWPPDLRLPVEGEPAASRRRR